jgi:hypothetical protein
MKRLGLILAALMGLAVQVVPASAAVQYTLDCTTVACTGGGFGNYGTVTLTQSGAVGAETIHVTVALVSGYQFGTKDTNSLLWNGTGNTDTLTVTGMTSDASAFAIQGSGANGTYIPASPFNATGAFDYAINRTNNGGTPTTLSFDVTKSGGLTLLNFATGNDGGAFFFGSVIRATASGDNFFVASNVPEPQTWLMFFAGLAVLPVLQFRRKRIKAA